MFGAEHSQYDIERAVKIANNWWEKSYKKEIIPEYITAVFELWKIECGEVREVRKGSNALSELLGIGAVLVTDNEERWNLIQNREPWECLPNWYRKTPIDLLIHIWATEYPKFNRDYFYDALAWLIIDCAKKHGTKIERINWGISLISASLRLADYHSSVAELVNKSMKEQYVKYAPKIKSYHKQSKGIVEELERKKENALQRGVEIRAYATELLENKKNPRSIVGIIENKKKYGKRTIRRDLKDHPSGHWKPKIKSDTQ